MPPLKWPSWGMEELITYRVSSVLTQRRYDKECRNWYWLSILRRDAFEKKLTPLIVSARASTLEENFGTVQKRYLSVNRAVN